MSEPGDRDPGPVAASVRDWLPWQPGDVVLTADGQFLTRADNDSAAEGWPWSMGAGYVHAPGIGPSGGWSEDQAKRPLTLLMRGGRLLGGAVINDQPVEGEVVRERDPLAQAPGPPRRRPGYPARTAGNAASQHGGSSTHGPRT